MKEIKINVDSYNSDSINTIQGNNNAEVYKIYVLFNKRRIDLTGKTVKMAYLRTGTVEGDVINLNITNATEGEITLQITNKISKKDGVYSCQLAIYGADGFLEHTATFGLTVEANIFTKIAGEIENSKDFTYLENILDKASKLSEKLKENTSSATNANSNLESNITEANNINSKLLENNEKATSLNKNLESNIDLAKEVKETIKDLDSKNIEATEKIEALTGLNSKATELSNNIQQGLPLNSKLVKNIESAKTINNELIATNNDAKAKKTDLDNSLEEAKKYIAGLDGSKNPVQMQLDINELKNGLKSNQSLSYEGSSIAANNTLEGRTEGMRIVGRTLNNLIVDGHTKKEIGVSTTSKAQYSYIFRLKENTKYTVIWEIEDKNDDMPYFIEISNFENKGQIKSTSKNKGIGIINTTTGSLSKLTCYYISSQVGGGRIKNVMVLEGDWTNKEIPSFFEGLKSFGEVEKVEDKYKISILSHGKNLADNSIFDINNYDNSLYRIYNKKFKPNTTYTCKSYLKKEFNKEKIRIWMRINEQNIILNSEPYYHVTTNASENGMLKIDFYCEGMQRDQEALTFIKEHFNIQFEESSNPTPYEHYKENKKDILIKEPLKEREYIYEDNGQVKVCRKSYEYTLNGENEDWIVWTNSTGDTVNAYVYFNRMTPNLSGIVKPNSSNINDRLPANQGGYLSTKEGFKVTSEYFAISIHKSKLGVTNVNDPNNSALIKKWLKENPLTMVCQRATPVVEIVDGAIDIDLDTYQDKTYFSINNTIPGNLDFKVPSNIASIVQANSKAINEIYDLIDKLILPNILQNTTDIEVLKIK
ncbi:BppU family phage baseplate upper protein [Clostridium perfringens]